MRRCFRYLTPSIASLGLALFASRTALSCPNCATAQTVRQSVFGVDFWMNLLRVSLPILVLAAITLLLYRMGMNEKRYPRKART
jgi:hypothetical protein